MSGTQNHPPPQNVQNSKSYIKKMFVVFFDIWGIVYFEFVPQEETVNSAFYLQVLKRLRVSGLTLKIWLDSTMTMLPTTRPSLLPISWPTAILQWSPSPDLVPCDFFFVSSTEETTEKKKHWKSVENIKKHVTFLRNIPIEEYQGAFQIWKKHLRKYIGVRREYFEKF